MRGAITLDGATASTLDGVLVADSGGTPGLVTATGSGTISIMGSGDDGVSITGAGTTVSTVAGALDITGLGAGAAVSMEIDGISVLSGGLVASTSGAVTLNGTGNAGTSLNRGVVVDGAGSLVTTGQTLQEAR